MARTFKLHQTSGNPYKETTTIVDTGLFRFSRNPTYITIQIFHAAVGLLFNSIWILLMTLPALIVVHYVVVLGEEAYLERKFGDAYLDLGPRRSWLHARCLRSGSAATCSGRTLMVTVRSRRVSRAL